MKNIFEKSVTEGVITRIENLSNESLPQWGKMNAGQMLAHLSVAYEFLYTDKYASSKATGFKKFIMIRFKRIYEYILRSISLVLFEEVWCPLLTATCWRS